MAAINCKTGTYFPGGLSFAGMIIAGFSVLIAFVDYNIGLPILLIGVVVATTHYRLSVDPDKKAYTEYIWFLGLRLGKSGANFDKIEYLFIKASRESQTMNMRVASSTVHRTVFDGYLRFSEHEKVHIATRDSRERLLNVLLPISSALNTSIIDHTQTVQG